MNVENALIAVAAIAMGWAALSAWREQRRLRRVLRIALTLSSGETAAKCACCNRPMVSVGNSAMRLASVVERRAVREERWTRAA
jgi:hypothetical protein